MGANDVGFVGLKVGFRVVGFKVVGKDGELEGENDGIEVVGALVGEVLGVDELGD